MSIRLETFDRARHRQELRRYTDLELILAGRQLRHLIGSEKNIVSPCGESSSPWKLQIEDAMAEWRTRQASRRAGVGVCLCHAPGSLAITSRAQMWKASGYEERLARRLWAAVKPSGGRKSPRARLPGCTVLPRYSRV
jgi:hypothetical protein